MKHNDWARLDAASIPSTLRWDIQLLRTLVGNDVLDIGCGPCPNFTGLEQFAGLKIGLDLSLEALVAARMTSSCSALILGDARAIPVSNGSLDLVLCKAVFTVMVYDEACVAVLAEAERILRPGGALLIADFLVNEERSYFAKRYATGITVGLPYGAFVAENPAGVANYLARHFQREWLANHVRSHPRLELESIVEKEVLTRTGKRTRGFNALIHRF